MFYIDGNTGVGGISDDKQKLVKIKFLNYEIYARKGVAFISHFTQTPIIPIISIRTGWLSREIHVHKPIFPDKNKERELYSKQTTQKLYRIFEKYLKLYPEQWEGWFYLHKFLDIKELKKIKVKDNQCLKTAENIFDINKEYKLNNDKYSIMTYKIADFLLSKETYVSSFTTLLFKTLSSL